MALFFSNFESRLSVESSSLHICVLEIAIAKVDVCLGLENRGGEMLQGVVNEADAFFDLAFEHVAVAEALGCISADVADRCLVSFLGILKSALEGDDRLADLGVHHEDVAQIDQNGALKGEIGCLVCRAERELPV